MNDTVTAMATRAECLTEGRFSRSHFQTFTRAIFLTHPKSATSNSSGWEHGRGGLGEHFRRQNVRAAAR
jgi:hypothetical protein